MTKNITALAVTCSAIFLLIAFVVLVGSQNRAKSTSITPTTAPKPQSAILPTNTEENVASEPAIVDQEDIITTFVSMSSIPFSRSEPATFTWRDQYRENSVQGESVKAAGLSSQQVTAIRSIFMEEGYSTDSMNEGAGTIIGQSGFKKEGNVCVMGVQVSNYQAVVSAPKAAPVTPAAQIDMTISCGLLTP